MTEKKRIYIAVKTYPTISEKYSELVCTAGVLEDGSWIRIYPMPFRLLKDEQKYPKYTWIEADVERNFSDFRPESYRPTLESIKVEPKPKTADWEMRRKILFNNKKVYTNLEEIISLAKNKENPISIVLFKPSEIINFLIEPDDRGWNSNKLNSLKQQAQQLSLFQTVTEIEEEFRVVEKVPYKFSYHFKDDVGKKSKLMIEDWEIGMLYFNCLRKAGGNEKEAIHKVREKYFDDFTSKRDIYLILGTTLRNHYVSKNPFVIIGVFYPPINQQLSFFDL